MLEKGDLIGDYKLERYLGRGQFGEVWLAEKQLQFSTRKVRHALKFLINAGEEFDPKAAEAEIDVWIEASGHPNVMSVIDMLLHRNHIVIISEFAEGGSLKAWLRQNGGKAPSIEKGLAMMVGILHGIEHLHSKNVVHRDLKPDNILLQGNFPRITDFGISRIFSSGSMSTKAMGSPAYMSPESFNGDKSPQNDIWSAGVILYELMTGTYPFSGETVFGLVGAIQTGQSKPLPESIPLEIREIIERALQRDRQKRFQTAQEMRLAVEKVIYSQKTKMVELTETPSFSPNLTLTDSLSDLVHFEQETITRPGQSKVTQKDVGIEQKEIQLKKENPAGVHSASQTKEGEPIENPRNWISVVGGIGGSLLLLALLGWAISPILFFSPENLVTNPAQGNFSNRTSDGSANSNVLPDLNANTAANKFPITPPGMVYVSGGEFTMGRNDGQSEAEKPAHKISVEPFFMDKFETTNAQYLEFVKATDHRPPADWKNGVYPRGQANFPVVNVNWEDASEFAKWANKRLPTEEEWEFAARGDGGLIYPWGNDWQIGKANVGGQSLAEVGKFNGVSPFGIYDLAGNAWEWTNSDFKPYPNGKLPDIFTGKNNLKTIRGGSFEATRDFATTTYRIGWEATNAPIYTRTGFRCVKDLK